MGELGLLWSSKEWENGARWSEYLHPRWQRIRQH
jgi:hypothetical protein